MVVLVFAVQIGLILWLSDRTPFSQRNPVPAPHFVLVAGDTSEWLALEDPTLLSLPHPQGFSGAAWLSVPSREFSRKSWTEPMRWLAPSIDALGANFQSFIETNPPPPFQAPLAIPPSVVMPLAPPLTPMSPLSRWRITGPLAERQLLNPFELRGWPGADLLSNSVVQVWVDSRGHVALTALMLPRSGSEEVDEHALRLARSARFNSIEVTGPERPPALPPDFVVGTITFEWQTLPPPTTNGVPGVAR
jgi:hypothetical protein